MKTKQVSEEGPVTTVAGGGEGLQNPKLPIKPNIFRRAQALKKSRKTNSIK